MEMLNADSQVVDDPPSRIIVTELGDNGVHLSVRPFVRSEDYWDVYYKLLEQVKLCLDEANITIPFPQRDLHIIAPDPSIQSND